MNTLVLEKKAVKINETLRKTYTPYDDTKCRWVRRASKEEDYYECSAKGDARFSAFNAFVDGKSIEETYQLDIKGYRSSTDNLLVAKGQKPLNNKTQEELWVEYLELWVKYLQLHPKLVDILLERVYRGFLLTDMFANSPVNQARALCEILNTKKFIKVTNVEKLDDTNIPLNRIQLAIYKETTQKGFNHSKDIDIVIENDTGIRYTITLSTFKQYNYDIVTLKKEQP